jgi:hypothetical protein
VKEREGQQEKKKRRVREGGYVRGCREDGEEGGRGKKGA